MAGKSCFVIMPFSSSKTCEEAEWTNIFEHVIKPAVEEYGLGYTCKRSKATRGNVVKEIIHDLVHSDVLIADLTDRNPNVFYELGVRHALHKNSRTIIIAQDRNDIPFDLHSYANHEYKWKLEKDKAEFKIRIKELLEDVERTPDKSDNPVADFLPQTDASTQQDLLPPHYAQLKQSLSEADLGIFLATYKQADIAIPKVKSHLFDHIQIDFDAVLSTVGITEDQFKISLDNLYRNRLFLRTDVDGRTLQHYFMAFMSGEDRKYLICLSNLGFDFYKALLGGEEKDGNDRQKPISDDDARILITDWLKSRSDQDNTRAINFDAVDEELKLPPNTTRQLLEGIARSNGFETKQRGDNFILLMVNRSTMDGLI